MMPSAKDRFTSLDTLAVVRELRTLERARVDKAYDVTTGGWSLSFRIPGEGRRELVLVPGRYAALVSDAADHPEELSPFARELRRLLTGAGLRGVAEPEGERYLELSFGRADDPDPLLVALEMFGTGNLTVAHRGRILAVAHPRKWAHRTVRVGAEYARPPVRKDPWGLSVSEVEAELARSRTDLTSTLAARLALGGPLAEELVVRAGRSGTEPAAPLAAELAGTLRDAMAALLGEVGASPHGYVYTRDGVLVDATPYPSRRWSAEAPAVGEERPTFSEAAYAYFRALVPPPRSEEESRAASARRELERQREQQRSAVEALDRSIADLQADAEAIFAHYSTADAARSAPASQAGDRDTVTVELGGRTVRLDRERSPRESAQALYEEAKRLQSKRAGAVAALAESDSRLSLPEPSAPPAARSGVAVPTAVPRRPFWFEKYRWFVSSDGAVVIAGRDAASNDLVVRRNLKEGDVYLHADLHGAASVIVKKPVDGSAPSEATLHEAGQWAASYSKAWRAGLAGASAFWVTPDQVSKAAASGEFVPRGAWVIHGTKHFLKDLPLELALGVIRYDGEERWSCAPPTAVRARGEVRCLVVPGEERDRGIREVELARELGVSRDLLQSLLPAGGISVRRP